MADIDWMDIDLDDFDPYADSPWTAIDAMEGGWCCYGSAGFGTVERCTCWEPIYDLPEQHRPMVGVPPVERPAPCWDCAYRTDSPEWQQDGGEHLADLAHGRGQFFCHDGIRRVIAYRHEGTGLVRPAGPGDYQPPIVTDQGRQAPYRADGLPGFICAGWAARHRRAGQPTIRPRTAPTTFLCH